MSAAKSAMIALGSAALVAALGVALYQGVWLKQVNLPALQARALMVLREGLTDADPAIRTRSAGLVGQSHDVSHANLLGPLLVDHDPLVQLQAAAGLRQLGARELVPALTAHGQLDLAMRVLERNGDMLWHASESAALVGALQAAGREEEARRVLRAAVEALDNRQGAMELVPAAGALLGAGAAERLGRAIEVADAQLEASALPGEGG